MDGDVGDDDEEEDEEEEDEEEDDDDDDDDDDDEEDEDGRHDDNDNKDEDVADIPSFSLLIIWFGRCKHNQPLTPPISGLGHKGKMFTQPVSQYLVKTSRNIPNWHREHIYIVTFIYIYTYMYLDLYKNIQDAGCQNRYMELSSLRCCSTHTHRKRWVPKFPKGFFQNGGYIPYIHSYIYI